MAPAADVAGATRVNVRMTLEGRQCACACSLTSPRVPGQLRGTRVAVCAECGAQRFLRVADEARRYDISADSDIINRTSVRES